MKLGDHIVKVFNYWNLKKTMVVIINPFYAAFMKWTTSKKRNSRQICQVKSNIVEYERFISNSFSICIDVSSCHPNRFDDDKIYFKKVTLKKHAEK